MSRFNTYAKRADAIAKTAFDEYRKAESNYKTAEANARQYPRRKGIVDADYAAKSARAHADLVEAKSAFDEAKRKFSNHRSEFVNIRTELAREVEKAYSIDAEQLDNKTLEILKSGILTGKDYSRLLTEAQTAGNPTMARLIGKYAGDAADAAKSDSERQTLRVVEYQSRSITGDSHLQAFDYLTDVFTRSANNPAMIDKWDELTADTVENF